MSPNTLEIFERDAGLLVALLEGVEMLLKVDASPDQLRPELTSPPQAAVNHRDRHTM